MTNPVSPVSAEELKPCPFCGKAPMWIHHSTRFDGHRLMSLGCCDFRKTGLEDTLIAAWNRRAPAASGATPEGYALVPIEPTKEMMQAAWDMANKLWDTPDADDPLPGHQYKAMIAAAPLTPDPAKEEA